MPGDEEDGEAELKSVVQVVVVDDDCRAEDDPDRDYRCGGELGFVGGRGPRRGSGDGRGQEIT